MKKQFSAPNYEAPVTSDFFRKRKKVQGKKPFIFNPLNLSERKAAARKRFIIDSVAAFVIICPNLCISLFSVGFCIATIIKPTDSPFEVGSSILLGLFTLFIAILSWRCFFPLYLKSYNNYQLFRKGSYIEAEVVKSYIQLMGQDETHDPVKMFTMVYEFVSPKSGKRIHNSETVERTDLSQGRTPNAGRVLQIVYLNDKTYQVI
jgi:hypothetical protein